MLYTKQEQEKIHSNLDKIKAYIETMQPRIRDEVYINFGPTRTYVDGTKEKAFHITITRDDITCRTGDLCFDFCKKNGTRETTAYSRYDYAVSLIENWLHVKICLGTQIQNQERLIELINNFEI